MLVLSFRLRMLSLVTSHIRSHNYILKRRLEQHIKYLILVPSSSHSTLAKCRDSSPLKRPRYVHLKHIQWCQVSISLLCCLHKVKLLVGLRHNSYRFILMPSRLDIHFSSVLVCSLHSMLHLSNMYSSNLSLDKVSLCKVNCNLRPHLKFSSSLRYLHRLNRIIYHHMVHHLIWVRVMHVDKWSLKALDHTGKVLDLPVQGMLGQHRVSLTL